jgi:hypothetical protein
MLAGMMSDDSVSNTGGCVEWRGWLRSVKLLQALVLLYFSPETADNQPLRQCLTYFLPVYCYSSSGNQRHMLDVSENSLSFPSGALCASSSLTIAVSVSIVRPDLLLYRRPLDLVLRGECSQC